MPRNPVLPAPALRTIRRINQLSNAKLIVLLLQGELSAEALAAESGIHYMTVLRYVAALRKEGAVFIDHYEADTRGAMRVKIFKLGFGTDAVPPVMTRAERAKRYRENNKARALHRAMSSTYPVGSTYWPAI